MKISLFTTLTLDGFIADKNGSEDVFSDQDNWASFVAASKKHKAILWGRKTHDIVKSWDEKYLEDLAEVKIYVLTNQKLKSSANVKYINHLGEITDEKQLLVSGGQQMYEYAIKNLYFSNLYINTNAIMINQGIKFPGSLNFFQKFEIEKVTEKTINYIQIQMKRK